MYPNGDQYYGCDAGPADLPLPHWGFGYYPGQTYSIGDLQDICAAWDTNMRNLAKMVSEVAGRPNPPDFTMFIDPYVALTERYSEARAIAQRKIDSASKVFTTKFADATSEYMHLLDVLNSHWKENTWTEGDWSFDDVLSRLMKMGASTKNNEPVPQPKTMDALQYANAAVSIFEAVPKFTATAITETAKGVVKTTTGAVGSALGIPSWAVIAGVVGLGIIILPKLLAFTPAGRAYQILR